MAFRYKAHTGPVWVNPLSERIKGTEHPALVAVLPGTEHVYIDIAAESQHEAETTIYEIRNQANATWLQFRFLLQTAN
jgi:hypothetical protein